MEGEEEIALLNRPSKLEEEEEEIYVIQPLPTPRDQLLKKIKPFYFGIAAGFLLLLLSLSSSSSSRPINTNNNTYCRWKFEAYEPSAYETFWTLNIKAYQDNVCAILMEDKHAEASKVIVQRSLQLSNIDKNITFNKNVKTPDGYISKSDDYFSRMIYSRECYDSRSGVWMKVIGRGEELIEPLWGFLRDPFDKWCNSQKLHWTEWPEAQAGPTGQSKAHILPQGYAPFVFSTTSNDISSLDWFSHGTPPWLSSLEPVEDPEIGTIWTPPKNVLLDLGSSYFGAWKGDATAASGAWMYKTYHNRGWKWDKYVAVEVEALQPPEAYKQLPADLVGAYSFMNVPLNVDPKDKLNVVSLLKSIAKSNDHVVIKLDIDSANMELPFAHSLRDDPALGALVSELYFEHHVRIYMMDGAWHSGSFKEDMNDSYQLFRALRRNGIRAHSWP